MLDPLVVGLGGSGHQDGGERCSASGHIRGVDSSGISTVCLHLEKYTGAGFSMKHMLEKPRSEVWFLRVSAKHILI